MLMFSVDDYFDSNTESVKAIESVSFSLWTLSLILLISSAILVVVYNTSKREQQKDNYLLLGNAL